MPTLHDSIHSLAQTFAARVIEAIRSASLEDILAESSKPTRGPGRPPKATPGAKKGARGGGGRLARRSAEDIAGLSDKIVGLVKSKPNGLRAEEIRAELGIAKNEWMRPLEHALASKKLTKKGHKRATTYFAR
jgi:hypothetical protein